VKPSITAILIALLLSGCSSVHTLDDSATRILTIYCGLYSNEERLLFRRMIEAGSVHKMEIQCSEGRPAYKIEHGRETERLIRGNLPVG